MEHTFYDDKQVVVILGLLDFGNPELLSEKKKLLAQGYNQFLFVLIDAISSNVTGPDYEQVIELLNTAIRSAYFCYKAADTKKTEKREEVAKKTGMTEQKEEEHEDFQWPDSNEGIEWEVSPFYAINIDNSIERQKEKWARHKVRSRNPVRDVDLILNMDALFKKRFVYLYFHPLHQILRDIYEFGRMKRRSKNAEIDKLIYLDVIHFVENGDSEYVALNRICHGNEGKNGKRYDNFNSKTIAKRYSTAKLGYEALISRWSRIFDGIP